MNIVIPAVNWAAIGPELILSLTAMGLLILNVLAKKGAKGAIPYLGLAGIVLALLFCFSLWGKSEYAFNRMVVVDNYSLFFKMIFLITAALTVLMSIRFLQEEDFEYGEYYILVLFAAVGMMFMASAADLLIIFLDWRLSPWPFTSWPDSSAPSPNPMSPP
jgi:NADH-quinone oxidoreductase subunit N